MTDRSQTRRLPDGGLIDRGRPLAFTFSGTPMTGFAGDTLASALLANGVDVVARSFKYHRPRGIMTDGPEEPNAIVGIGDGPSHTPNLKATEVPLVDGLVARSQNCWPSVDRDLGALAGLAAPLLHAGFYYKTFMAPDGAWPRLYEKLIRRAAGLGRAPQGNDPDRYEHRHAHCDVLVIGAGPAGLSAARTLARAGVRVILCNERSSPGGALTAGIATIDGELGATWASRAADEIAASTDALVLHQTTAVWRGDHGLVTLSERVQGGVAERLWLVRARHIVLATGAIERPLCFPGNDRPGIMLASAASAYINRYGVRPGSRAIVYTNNDSAYGRLVDLVRAGIDVAAIVDGRPQETIGANALARAGDVALLAGHDIVSTEGRHRPQGVCIAARGSATQQRLDADLLCVAGGWSPTLHLLGHLGGSLRFDAATGAYQADAPGNNVIVAGAAGGVSGLGACLADGIRAASAILSSMGRAACDGAIPVTEYDTDLPAGQLGDTGRVTSEHKGRGKAFVDLQNDVTAADLDLAIDEGYGAIEHLKRYTTTGMGTDQGKLGNVLAISLVAARTGRPAEAIGHTTFRPPYTPVTLGALAGAAKDDHLVPTRRTPFHDRHLGFGALMELSGEWDYPKCYLHDDENVEAAIAREVRTVRRAVGFVDMSTLGKVEVIGPDAAVFLDRVYANRISSLPEGRCRYALMLREDGIVYDDGTVTRMAAERWHITASTAHARGVWRHLTRLQQVAWPELDVCLIDVSEQWAGLALAGPKARDVLTSLLPELDVSTEGLPFLGFREAEIGGRAVRIFRISYSGELAYEIYVGAEHAGMLWDAVVHAGRPYGIAPYGVEALDVMRIEKGHVAGSEIDGHATTDDLGLGRMVKRDTAFLGSALAGRPAHADPDRPAVVGLLSADDETPIPRGGLLVTESAPDRAVGHVTAAVLSPTLDRPIALAMLARSCMDAASKLCVVSPTAGDRVAVVRGDLPFYDPAGEKMRA